MAEVPLNREGILDVALDDVEAARMHAALGPGATWLDAAELARLEPALSHGERRQLEVALALATEPRLLLLDEPTAGMSAADSARFAELVESLGSGVAVLIIEHDLDVVFRLATRVTVLHLGRVLADGTPDRVRADETVQRAYLGDAALEDLFLEETR